MSHRAGMAIEWSSTRKEDYLEALTRELLQPEAQHLDTYLRPFMQSKVTPGPLLDHLLELRGLDGADDDQDSNVAYAEDDPRAMDSYLSIEVRGVAWKNQPKQANLIPTARVLRESDTSVALCLNHTRYDRFLPASCTCSVRRGGCVLRPFRLGLLIER